jgi:para-nitrobenzyl esterase
VQAWDGTRDAGVFGPAAAQRRTNDDWDPTGGGSGDWLTVNIWSADLGAARLPVMVFIHGGAYQQGTAANPHCDGVILAAGGVVVVSMNYRVGVEGFAHIEGALDNRGLLDQLAALRWVQDNIAAFGGDPDNVTVFGQSAGAGSIAALLAMPLGADSFQRAIVQSLPGTFFSPRLADAVSTAIAAELGTTATLEAFAAHSPRDLVLAADKVRSTMGRRLDSWGPIALTPSPFSPVVDGEILPQDPWSALRHGRGRSTNLLVGHTRDEARLLVARLGGAINDEMVAAALHRLAPSPASAGLYRAAWPQATPAELYETVNADWLMRMPTLQLAQAQVHGGGTAWTYELTWAFGPEGASHSLDLLLVLGTLGDDRVRSIGGPQKRSEYLRLAGQMRADWLAFATHGDPGWTPYHPTAQSTRVYDATTATKPYPEQKSQQIWAEHCFGVIDLLD